MKSLMIHIGTGSGYPREVAQQTRRLSGDSAKLLRAYQESPARYLPKGRGLRGVGAGKKTKNIKFP
jgi:hypothetical protein